MHDPRQSCCRTELGIGSCSHPWRSHHPQLFLTEGIGQCLIFTVSVHPSIAQQPAAFQQSSSPILPQEEEEQEQTQADVREKQLLGCSQLPRYSEPNPSSVAGGGGVAGHGVSLIETFVP